MSAKITVVAKNTACHGEGPHWDDVTESLYYVDCMEDEVHNYSSVTGLDTKIKLGDSVVTTIMPRQKGGFVVSRDNHIDFLDSWDSGKVTNIAQVGKHFHMLNDGKCDASGRLWIGSMADLRKPPPADVQDRMGSLHSVETDGSVRNHVGNIVWSNGMDWTDDYQTMFYVDHSPGKIYGFDFDLTAGKISNQRTVVDFSSTGATEMGKPDGMTVDSEGMIWVACYKGGKVVRVDPKTGQIIQTVTFPAMQITSCCFGGKNYDELYVTSSHLLMTEEEIQKTPLAGSVFKVTELGVKGRKANMYLG